MVVPVSLVGSVVDEGSEVIGAAELAVEGARLAGQAAGDPDDDADT